MITQKDLRRLLETRHDLDKTQDPAALTTREGLQAALTESHSLFTDSRERFLTAYRDVQRETQETDAARVGLLQARDRAIVRYRYTRAQAEHATLTIDPDDAVSPDVYEQRERLLNAHFPHASALQSLGEDKLTATLESILLRAQDEPTFALDALKLDKLAAAIASLQRTRAAIQGERLDDTQAQAALRQARTDLDTEHRVHTALTKAALIAEGRADDFGLYIKSLDRAYRNRRRSNAPLEDEPELSDILPPTDPPVA